ncbi:MAG: cell division protein SepF [Actinobacteria bacterium]|nr:cell division protein SepF [Actinomycetota bacterium]
MGNFFKKTLSFLGLAEDSSSEYSNEEYPNTVDRNYDEGRNYLHERYDEGEDPKGRKNFGSFKPARRLLSIDGTKDLKKFRVSISEPHDFEEVQSIGDNFKENTPVIVNLQNTNPDLSKRIIDFCSGLTYALEGSIKKVADKVFLITPKNTVVTSNEKEILKERGLYRQL